MLIFNSKKSKKSLNGFNSQHVIYTEQSFIVDDVFSFLHGTSQFVISKWLSLPRMTDQSGHGPLLPPPFAYATGMRHTYSVIHINLTYYCWNFINWHWSGSRISFSFSFSFFFTINKMHDKIIDKIHWWGNQKEHSSQVWLPGSYKW